jgi:16S rRNA (cytosine967-C5)-methyltransferase
VGLPTGGVRLLPKGRIEALPGYGEGAWWVQDAAATLPAHLLNSKPGMRIADLCAAPGGKTAQLALGGASVVAVDISKTRLKTLEANLARLGLAAATVQADVTTWAPEERFDAVLLDAPCSSTGTIRRHPDIPYLKSAKDIEELVRLQERLLDNAVRILKPGGILVYSTCSLELEEGEAQVASLLQRNPNLRLDEIAPSDVFGRAECVQPPALLRTFPYPLDLGTPA